MVNFNSFAVQKYNFCLPCYHIAFYCGLVRFEIHGTGEFYCTYLDCTGLTNGLANIAARAVDRARADRAARVVARLELLGLCWNILDDALGDAGGHQRGVVLPLLSPRPVLDSRQ